MVDRAVHYNPVASGAIKNSVVAVTKIAKVANLISLLKAIKENIL